MSLLFMTLNMAEGRPVDAARRNIVIDIMGARGDGDDAAAAATTATGGGGRAGGQGGIHGMFSLASDAAKVGVVDKTTGFSIFKNRKS